MKAIITNGFGGIETFVITELPIPSIKSDEVLIRVRAISINPVDVKTRAGKGASGFLKGQDPVILGWDVSGVVEKSASGLFKEGDEVFGMVNFPGHGKAYAEYVAAPATHLAKKPSNITHEEAAASTLAALTALEALTIHYKTTPGQRVLIQAASGGVGHFAVQIAKQLGAHVTGTSSAKNKDFVLGLGADAHVDYKAGPLEEAVSNMDFVLDVMGGEAIDHALLVLKKGGTIISIVHGITKEKAEKAKSLGVHDIDFLVHSNGQRMTVIAEMLENGSLKPHIERVFKLEEIAEAHLQLETGRTVGKIVLTV